jgi:MFS family permease
VVLKIESKITIMEISKDKKNFELKEFLINESNNGNQSHTTQEKSIGGYLSRKSNFNQNEKILYDAILEEYGYGWEIWKVILGVVCIFITDSYFEAFFPAMVTSYESMFNLSQNQISLIGFAYYICKMTGCLSTGFMIRKSSREKYLKTSLFILLISNILLSFTNKLWMLFSVRILSALISGFLEVLGTNFLCEFLPIYLRSFTLNSTYIGWALAPISLNFIMLHTMPNLEPSGIQITHKYFSFIILICFIYVLIFVTDSPRNLILNDCYESAFKILQKMKANDLNYFTKEIKNQIIREIKGGVNDQSKHHFSYFEIFTKKNYFIFTMCVGFIVFETDALLQGGKLINNLVLEKINEEKKINDYHSILVENIWINCLDTISCIFYGFLTELKIFGRKKTILIGLVFMGLAILPGLFYYKMVAPGFVIFFFCNVSNVTFTYASEFYPTRIRDTALGWMNFFGHAGAASSQYLLVLPMKIHWKCTLITMIIMSFLCILVFRLNPYETHGKPIDCKSDYFYQKKDILEEEEIQIIKI